MSGRIRVLAALAVLGLVMTGCFKIGWFRLTDQVIRNGERNILELGLYPVSPEGDKSHPFVLLHILEEGESGSSIKTTSPKVFDRDAHFGATKRKLVFDRALRDVAADNEACDFFLRAGMIGPQGKLIALRTENPVNDKGKLNREALTRIGLKYQSEADPFPGSMVAVQAITGAWADNTSGEAPGEASPDDDLVCTSDTTTFFSVKPDPDAAEPTTTSTEAESLLPWRQ